MAKGKIVIPKENQECKDGKCGHQHEFPFEIQDPKPEQAPATVTFDNPAASAQTTQLMQPPLPTEEKKLKHEDIAEIAPVNFMKCPGGDCGHQRIKAKNQVRKFKTCKNDNCESNTVRKDQPCPACGKNYEEDEWNDLDDGVDLEEDED